MQSFNHCHECTAAKAARRSLTCHGYACSEDIVWTLQTLNPNVLELNRLWHEHGYATAVRLLDVASPDLLERLPVKVSSRALPCFSMLCPAAVWQSYWYLAMYVALCLSNSSKTWTPCRHTVSLLMSCWRVLVCCGCSVNGSGSTSSPL